MSFDEKLWRGLEEGAAAKLSQRDYATASLAERLSSSGVDASQLLGEGRKDCDSAWIAGVEIFPRQIYTQPFRGVFGEFARQHEGILAELKLWPQQWASARMYAGTAKGFHVHPPFIPEGEDARDYLSKQFAPAGGRRAYEREQWDVMFFVQGRVEIILRDVRAGFPPRTMRFLIDGDNHRGANNVGIVIPPGVAHALRVEGAEDAIMVYGTSTSFRAEFEGRIASEVETAELPDGWGKFLAS